MRNFSSRICEMVINAATINDISAMPRFHSLRLFWRRFVSNKLAAVALIFIIFQIIIAVTAPYIAPYNPYKGDFLATWETPNRAALARHGRFGTRCFFAAFIRRKNINQHRRIQPTSYRFGRHSDWRACRIKRWLDRITLLCASLMCFRRFRQFFFTFF